MTCLGKFPLRFLAVPEVAVGLVAEVEFEVEFELEGGMILESIDGICGPGGGEAGEPGIIEEEG